MSCTTHISHLKLKGAIKRIGAGVKQFLVPNSISPAAPSSYSAAPRLEQHILGDENLDDFIRELECGIANARGEDSSDSRPVPTVSSMLRPQVQVIATDWTPRSSIDQIIAPVDLGLLSDRHVTRPSANATIRDPTPTEQGKAHITSDTMPEQQPALHQAIPDNQRVLGPEPQENFESSDDANIQALGPNVRLGRGRYRPAVEAGLRQSQQSPTSSSCSSSCGPSLSEPSSLSTASASETIGRTAFEESRPRHEHCAPSALPARGNVKRWKEFWNYLAAI